MRMKVGSAIKETNILHVSKSDHTQGNTDAPVTLIEYADFECPYCGQAYEVLKEVQEELGEELLFVFRHFPLVDKHPHAETAAEAAEAAATHRKFWELHDLIFENQDALENEDLAEYAAIVGLDAKELLGDLQSGRFGQPVQKQFKTGVKAGVNGTPFFFINGRAHEGHFDFDSLIGAIASAQRA